MSKTLISISEPFRESAIPLKAARDAGNSWPADLTPLFMRKEAALDKAEALYHATYERRINNAITRLQQKSGQAPQLRPDYARAHPDQRWRDSARWLVEQNHIRRIKKIEHATNKLAEPILKRAGQAKSQGQALER
jgi:hypothetical protein